jgi:hypothetical protein
MAGPGGWEFVKEVQALAAGRLCWPEVRRKCQVENGAFADWACQACQEFVRPEAISPWTWHLVWLWQLQRAGYPFRANDLSLETWLRLGLVRHWLEGTQGGTGGGRTV